MSEQRRVTASSLHVRTGPGIRFPSVGGLTEGQIIDVLEKSPDGTWARVKSAGLEGWSSLQFLEPMAGAVQASSGVESGEFPWLPIALAEVGVREVSADGDNPRVIEYLKSTNIGAPKNANDETPWCSGFVNWCVEQAGMKGTNSAAARSWATWGTALEVPRRGCIAVFTRGPVFGHVGFYMGETATEIDLLAGNQSDAVNIAPRSKATLIGYRIPAS